MDTQTLHQPFKLNDVTVFEGDSSVNRRAGSGLSTWPYLRMMNWDRSWCDILAELMFCWYAPLNLSFHNVGIGGSTSKQVLDRFTDHIADYRPNWIIISIGGNDVSQQIPILDTQQHVRDYIQCANQNCNASVIYVGGFLAYPNCPQSKREMQPLRQERYAAIREAALSAGGYYLDIGQAVKVQADALYEQYQDHNMYCGDDAHFSHMGNTVIAGAVLRALGYLNP